MCHRDQGDVPLLVTKIDNELPGFVSGVP
jgi:hypothetical protein